MIEKIKSIISKFFSFIKSKINRKKNIKKDHTDDIYPLF